MVGVSVIIPAYNLEDKIAEVVRRCPPEYEIIVVDDGSCDNTYNIAKKTGARVYRHQKNEGKGRAMITGIPKATGDIVVFIDGDLQHRPEDIPKLVEPIQNGEFDMVIGSRRIGSRTKMPIIRRLSNKLTNIIIRMSTGLEISDTQSGFRAIKREYLSQMKLESRRYEIETEILVWASRLRLRVGEVHIDLVYGDTKSYFSPVDVWNFLKTALLKRY
ncbi:MAG: glycosyltransferase family 2 protein [Candidatus Methanofastidiosia archaeon]